jgi:hypothetical protein
MEVVGAWLHAFDDDGVQGWVNWINNYGVINDWFWNGGGGGDQSLNCCTDPLFSTCHITTHHNDWFLVNASRNSGAECGFCA